MSTQKDVMVALEPFGESADLVNRGLLTEGCRIASFLGGKLHAVSIGSPLEDSRMLQRHGVSSFYELEGKCLSQYDPEVFAWAMKNLLKDLPFRILLFAHLQRGSELAPRLGHFFGSAAVTDCIDIRLRDKALFYVRSVYGGQFEQEVFFARNVPEIATIRPDLLSRREARSTFPRIFRIPVEIPPDVAGITVLESVPPDFKTVDIVDAERIIGTGLGCTEPGLLELVEELAQLLGGSIAATRPVVDDGLMPKMRMVGQTGKTVTPDFYLALGISGSPHHLAGIQQSKKILSVNVDPRAPIFDFSDTGFIGDLKAVLPKLIERIRRYRDEGVA